MAVPCLLSHVMIYNNVSLFLEAHIKVMLYIFPHFLLQKTITKFVQLCKVIAASLAIALNYIVSVLFFEVVNFGYLTLEENIEEAKVTDINALFRIVDSS